MTRMTLAVGLGMLVGACGGDDPATVITGELEVTTLTTGEAADADGYSVLVDGSSAATVGVNGTVTLDVAEGEHSVELADIAGTCAVDGENPVSVTVTADEAAIVTFSIICGDG
jgi:hypothetical protein